MASQHEEAKDKALEDMPGRLPASHPRLWAGVALGKEKADGHNHLHFI